MKQDDRKTNTENAKGTEIQQYLKWNWWQQYHIPLCLFAKIAFCVICAESKKQK